jgi:hypothetical protein
MDLARVPPMHTMPSWVIPLCLLIFLALLALLAWASARRTR